MKRKVFLIFFVLPLLVSGQISVNQSDMPSAGDTVRTSTTVDFGFIDFEETGSDFTWDFTSFIPFSQAVDTFVSVSETPFFYQILFFFTANLAQQEFEFDLFPGFQMTDSYRFFKNSSASFKEVGIGVTLNGLPLPTLYEDPDVIYKFPLDHGNIDSSFASYSFDIPGLGYYGGWKKRKNNVDGWGTVTTPYGTFETLRLKTEIIQYDSLYIDSLGLGIPIQQAIMEYKWLGKEKGLPLVHVTDNGILQTVTYLDSLRNILSVNTPYTEIPKFDVYPNPAINRIQIVTDLSDGKNVQIDLVNLSGEIVFTKGIVLMAGRSFVSLDRTELPQGIYVLRCNLNGVILHRKLVLQ